MLKLYIFWGIFALVLIGIAATLIRDRRWRRKRAEEEAKSGAVSTAGAEAAVSPPADAVSPPVAAFDPTATRIYVRTIPASTHSALPNRKEVQLSGEAVPRLVCVSGTQKDHKFPITSAGITVGRSADNDIVIADARASHRHAWVGIIDHKVVLRDLGSTNGTFLNARIDSPVSEVVLTPGDTIFFGGHGRDQFRFVVD